MSEALEPPGVPPQQLSLHWATTWVPAAEQLRRSVIPAFVACFFVGPINVALFYSLFVLLPTVLYYLIRFWTVTYQILPYELVIHSGVLNRRERRIPFNRIQETELKQDLIRRPLAIACLTIKTAGGDEQEASLDAITVDHAKIIQSRSQQDVASDAVVVATRGATRGPSNGKEQGVRSFAAADYECKLSTRDLIVGGMTSNAVATLFAVVSTFAYFQFSFGRGWRWFGGPQVPNRIPERLGELEKAWTPRIEDWVPDFGPLNFLVELAFSETLFRGLAIALLGLLASVLAFVLRYHGFTLFRRGDVLTVSRGLLTHHEGQLSRQRIQSLKLEEGLLRRTMGLASVHVDSAGDRQKVDENKKREVLLPVAARPVAIEVARQAIPGMPNLAPDWSRVSRLAVGRGTKKGSLIVIAMMIQAYVWSPRLSLALLPLFPIVYGLNWAWYRHTGYSISQHHFLYRSGWLNRSTSCLPIANVQNVALSRSPFDRRLGLATLAIDTAGQSNTGGGPVIRHLPLIAACRLRRQLSARVADTPFIW